MSEKLTVRLKPKYRLRSRSESLQDDYIQRLQLKREILNLLDRIVNIFGFNDIYDYQHAFRVSSATQEHVDKVNQILPLLKKYFHIRYFVLNLTCHMVGSPAQAVSVLRKSLHMSHIPYKTFRQRHLTYISLVSPIDAYIAQVGNHKSRNLIMARQIPTQEELLEEEEKVLHEATKKVNLTNVYSLELSKPHSQERVIHALISTVMKVKQHLTKCRDIDGVSGYINTISKQAFHLGALVISGSESQEPVLYLNDQYLECETVYNGQHQSWTITIKSEIFTDEQNKQYGSVQGDLFMLKDYIYLGSQINSLRVWTDRRLSYVTAYHHDFVQYWRSYNDKDYDGKWVWRWMLH